MSASNSWPPINLDRRNPSFSGRKQIKKTETLYLCLKVLSTDTWNIWMQMDRKDYSVVRFLLVKNFEDSGQR